MRNDDRDEQNDDMPPEDILSSLGLDTMLDGMTMDNFIPSAAEIAAGKKGKGKGKRGGAKTVNITSTHTRCFHKHPPLPITVDGKTYHVIGGSCTSGQPEFGTVDIYIGLDYGMEPTALRLPWNDGVEFVYQIRDMSVPKNAGEFKDLIDWVASQVLAGKRVFVGCIGGHGRTGLFLSALVKVMTGEEDAITYVRENYCKKAVETAEQVNWLGSHFGIKPVTGYKEFSGRGFGGGRGYGAGDDFYRGPYSGGQMSLGGWSGGSSKSDQDWHGTTTGRWSGSTPPVREIERASTRAERKKSARSPSRTFARGDWLEPGKRMVPLRDALIGPANSQRKDVIDGLCDDE